MVVIGIRRIIDFQVDAENEQGETKEAQEAHLLDLYNSALQAFTLFYVLPFSLITISTLFPNHVYIPPTRVFLKGHFEKK